MYKTFLIKYSEIALKGRNRYIFEDALMGQIKYALRKAEGDFKLAKTQGRIFVNVISDFYDYDETIIALKKVFGINAICPVSVYEKKDYIALKSDVLSYLADAHPNQGGTFKVETKRVDKYFPMTSMEISSSLGGDILNAYPAYKVDVHKPKLRLNVEIREKVYLYSTQIEGIGGLPAGTGGKAMLLLSGGIDSPVAGFMVAKRGVKIDAVYFHAPPFTSEQAKQKVIDLAKTIADYAGPVYLHVINFTDIQKYIYEKCPHEELTIHMRRYMMRIAQKLALETECLGLITGESIGQVASQTMQSLIATNEVVTLPVYRPLIGMDKVEIIDIAQKIGTFDTSILPFEDCCTIFVAKHPVTRPNLEYIKRHEKNLSGKIDELLAKAYDTEEIIVVRAI